MPAKAFTTSIKPKGATAACAKQCATVSTGPAEAGEFEAFGFQLNARINQLMLHEANRIMPITTNQISNTSSVHYAQHNDHILEVDIDSRIHVRTGIGGKGMTASAGYAEHSINSLYAI